MDDDIDGGATPTAMSNRVRERYHWPFRYNVDEVAV